MNAEAAIRKYFDAIKACDRESLESLLDPQLVHRSPWKTYDERDAMLDDIWPHLDGSVWVEDLVVECIEAESQTFDAHYVHGGRTEGTRLTERFTFDGDRIVEIEVTKVTPPSA